MPTPRYKVPALMLVAAVSGAVVMAVELLGARMLGASFGGSMEVWAAMISVTLLSLAAGYFAGGALADRRPQPAWLCGVLLLAAVLIALCPHLQFVLRGCYHAFGLRLGALASSAALWFVPLFLQGMTGPFVIRLLAREATSAGRVAGGVYAVSTLGSVFGTLATGLWLIPALGTARGFQVAALALGLTGALGLLFCRRPRPAAAGLLLLAALALVAPRGRAFPGAVYLSPDGERVTVEAVRDSAYGRMAVLTKNRYRLLAVNGIVQTGFPLDFARLGKGHFLLNRYYQELIPYLTDEPRGKRVLTVGLAGGMTARILDGYGMQVEAVDIDPAVIAMAREWFGFRGEAVAADGRFFLETCGRRYDFCVIDTYAGDTFPAHLASREAFRAARGVLAPGGALVVNYIGAPRGAAFAALAGTVGLEFRHLRAIRGEDSDDVQTVTLFASDRPLAFNKGWLDHLATADGRDPVSEALARLDIALPPGSFTTLTDDHNPIDFLRAAEAVRWRERSLRNIGEQAVF